jgi:hypothetical protein
MPDEDIGEPHFTGHVDLHPETRVPGPTGAAVPQLPKGFECKTCGQFNEFPAYVFAHWSELLVHDCPRCGAQHEVCRGAVDQTVPGKKPVEQPAELTRTPWFTPSFYPSREGWYEARFFSMPSAGTRTPDTYDRVRFDGTDWELEDDQVLVAWRGLVEDPAGDL